jgi:hypothetical protein
MVSASCTVERIRYEKCGRAILDDHFIQRYGASQFMGLTNAQYQAGIDRIRAALDAAEKRGEEAVFRSEFALKMIVGRVRDYAPAPSKIVAKCNFRACGSAACDIQSKMPCSDRERCPSG